MKIHSKMNQKIVMTYRNKVQNTVQMTIITSQKYLTDIKKNLIQT